MAFTAYRTWVANDVLSAAQLNEQVRDNGNQGPAALVTTAGDIAYATGSHAMARLGLGTIGGGVGNPKYIVKTADESVTSSASLQNDDHLALTVGANEAWIGDLWLVADGNSTANLKYAFTFPAAATFAVFFIARDTTGTLGSISGSVSSGSAIGSGLVGHTAGTPVPAPMLFRYAYYGGANAGTLQFQWAQNTSNGTATILKKGSYMTALKVS